ncbi:helix-turn-helix domain-containing protein [Actinocrispum sp. NPDC049592]|uniref:helix-turn-helix domain-containing protein n=1 Tax=Actinocrispum sp. NPDC049592 TaxID=3154835 RepID=UPI00342CD61B
MIATAQTEKFAAYLRMLKDRSGRGFERLGKQAGISGSSLHRYCSGLSVPTDYRVVHTFGKVCGASAEELRELHQLWALADAERDVPEAAVEQPPPPEEEKQPKVSRQYIVLGLVAILLVGGVAWVTFRPSAEQPADGRLLFSPACSQVSMGQHDECVTEVQNLLSRAHAKITVDGDFGPETLKRVTAFQVLAGITPRGVVDAPTKTALYDQKTSMEVPAPAAIEQKVRAVFTEDPDKAVAIARCASFLDPLWVLPNTNGSRNWGVFQISDARLQELGGTPRIAFDPDWNIQAAHRLWAVRRDFHDWPACEAALQKPTQ